MVSMLRKSAANEARKIERIFEKAKGIGREVRPGGPEPAPEAVSRTRLGGYRKGGRLLGLRRLILLSVLCVLASLAAAVTPASAAELFNNPAPITIPDSGPASPYPSEIAVSGMTGPIADMSVTLHRFGHTYPADVDILLVSPSGRSVVIMSDACGRTDIEDFTWVFSQSAPRKMSRNSSNCAAFAYRPSNDGTVDPWEPPAPAGPYSTSLDAFNGEDANGTWRLYVRDQFASESGDIEGGWSLSIQTDTTTPTVVSVSPASNATGVAVVANVGARFSEAMRESSIHPNTFQLFKAGTTTRIGAKVSYDAAAKRALLNPTPNLKPGTRYRAVVTTGARDLSGNQLDQDPNIEGSQQRSWLFTTRN